MREKTYEAYKSGLITLEEAQAITLYLQKKEYREQYNKRPEVRERRKAYNRERNAKASIGRQLLNQLIGSKEEKGE